MMKTQPRTIRRRAGFTLMEVLVAIGIFALGFVAVAAIFPAAALMQRGTSDDVESRHVERNARAIIQATWPSYEYDSGTGITGDLAFYHSDDTSTDSHVKPFEPDMLTGPGAIWSLDARSYPAYNTEPDDRQYYWVPLIRDTAGDAESPSWQIYVFVFNRQRDSNYVRDNFGESNWKDEWANPDDGHDDGDDTWAVPGVRRVAITVDQSGDDSFVFDTGELPAGVTSATDLLRVNDMLLYERNGQIFRVTGIDTTEGRVTVNGRITTGDPPESSQHIWIAFGGRDTSDPMDGEPNNFRHRPGKRLFTITN